MTTTAHPAPSTDALPVDALAVAALAGPVLGLPGQVDGPFDLPCRLVDPDLFFAESPADVEAAKALCVPCPLRTACLAGATARREPWGVWGGELFVQGVVVARKRPRGRPRKDAEPLAAPAAVRVVHAGTDATRTGAAA